MSEVERLLDSDPQVEPKTLEAKIVAACALMGTPKFDKVNPHFKSKYASLAAINAVVRPALLTQGVSYRQTIETSDNQFWLVTYAYDAEKEIELSRVVASPVGKAQDRGSDLTYSKRQGLSAAFGVVADEDDDGNAAQAAQEQAEEQAISAEFRQIFANYRDAVGLDGKSAAQRLQAECNVQSAISDKMPMHELVKVRAHMLEAIAGVAYEKASE